MTRQERLARLAGLVVTLLPLAPAQADAQQVGIVTDTVTTVFVTDTVPGFGAVGGVVTDALELAPGHAQARARLDLVTGGP